MSLPFPTFSWPSFIYVLLPLVYLTVAIDIPLHLKIHVYLILPRYQCCTDINDQCFPSLPGTLFFFCTEIILHYGTCLHIWNHGQKRSMMTDMGSVPCQLSHHFVKFFHHVTLCCHNKCVSAFFIQTYCSANLSWFTII